MWALIKEGTGETFPMVANVQYKIGRLGADLILKDDKSISGTHAYLAASEGAHTDSLELEDAGSKNGTFVNEDIRNRKPLKKHMRVKMNEDDLVQFGVMGNTWRVRYMRCCSASSGLTSVESDKLVRILEKCGGKHVLAFDKHCTHLTMSEIKVTLKVINALLWEVPIVNIDYWQDLLSVARKEKNGPICSIDNYIPHVTDMLLAHQNLDIRSRKDRKSVFAGKIFVFLSQKHFEIYAPIVEEAGGSSRGLKNGVQKAFLVKKDVIVVQYIPSIESQNSQGTQTINTIAEYLETNSRRFIPEYEIALAIVHCSTEKYCNPNYKTISNMFSSTSTGHDSESMFVQNTSVTNEQAKVDSCNLIILETERQCAPRDQLLESLPLDTNRYLFKEKESKNSMNIPSMNKRVRQSVGSSDSEPDAELTNCIKKAHVEQSSSRENHSLRASKHWDKKTAKEQPLYPNANRRNNPSLPDMSEEEDDLFNFGDNAQSSPVPKKQRRISTSNQFHDNSFALPRNKPACINDGLGVQEHYDSVPTQPAKPKTAFLGSTFLLRRKILPEKLSIEGWKTFSVKNISEMSLKSEISSQLKFENEDENFGCHSEPFKGGFQIKMSTVVSRNYEDMCIKAYGNKTNLTVSRINAHSRGFKKFIKQTLHRQH